MASGNLKILRQREDKLRMQTEKLHKREIDLIEGLLDVFINGFNTIQSYTYEEDYKHAWMLLLTRSFRSLVSSYSLLNSGQVRISLVTIVAQSYLTLAA
jgi:hypothetical protein